MSAWLVAFNQFPTFLLEMTVLKQHHNNEIKEHMTRSDLVIVNGCFEPTIQNDPVAGLISPEAGQIGTKHHAKESMNGTTC